MNIGQVLRNQRHFVGMDLRQLADASGIHRNTIGRVERGLNSPRVETLHPIVEALGLTLADFFNLVEEEINDG